MHPNQARPFPRPSLHACAWGTCPAAIRLETYAETTDEVFAWAEKIDGVHTVFVEDTSDAYPYRINGRVYDLKAPGVWTKETA